MLAYFALAENESIGRERYNFMQKLIAALAIVFRLIGKHYIHGIAWEHANIPAVGNPYVCENQGNAGKIMLNIRKCFCLVVYPQKEKMIETCSAQPVSAVAN
ncbi:hypothetical protein OIU78_004362 [Salix suchowensis]|nr:hypothetical protein OIU78_004362 [Salix suchowensis]